jgi:hypothetical protein
MHRGQSFHVAPLPTSSSTFQRPPYGNPSIENDSFRASALPTGNASDKNNDNACGPSSNAAEVEELLKEIIQEYWGEQMSTEGPPISEDLHIGRYQVSSLLGRLFTPVQPVQDLS